MNNLVINNKEYSPSEIGTINTPMDKQNIQRRMGMNVIANTVKALRYASIAEHITCIIHYGCPRTPFIQDILNNAVYNGKDVYYRVDNNNIVYEATEPKKTARDRYIEKQEYKQQYYRHISYQQTIKCHSFQNSCRKKQFYEIPNAHTTKELNKKCRKHIEEEWICRKGNIYG